MYFHGDILLTLEGNIPSGLEPPVAVQPWNHVTTLHVGDYDYLIYGLDYPIEDNPHYFMCGLRKSFQILSLSDYQLAGKGQELLYWDSNTKYCGCCGAPTKWHTEISKHCTECGKEWWPQLAIAIIVRILREDKILLVHSRSFRTQHYGLIAGFVETGETLEEAVRRECREETGIEIKDLKYFGSQPWPYPCGLMVGFTAQYAGGKIHLQKEELGSGDWFGRNNLPQIPDKASIARQLIDDWLCK